MTGQENCKSQVDERVRRVGELFPDLLTEHMDAQGHVRRSIDFERLRRVLGDAVSFPSEERYELTWPGKHSAILAADIPPSTRLEVCREESVDFGHTRNLYIEGDNLDVLKLLRDDYRGRVKMIYIDPPYNTGHGFIYRDSLTHSDWLNMMYPRLKIARELLRDDGVIFISIDDGELADLRKICDEIFGMEAFVNCIAVKMSEPTGLKMRHQWRRFPKLKEYILFYKMPRFERFCAIDKYRHGEWDPENNILLEGLTKADRAALMALEDKEVNTPEDVAEANAILQKVTKTFLSQKLPTMDFKTKEKCRRWLFDNSYRIIKTAGSNSLARHVATFRQIPPQAIAAALSPEGVLFYYITDYNRQTPQPRLRVIFADRNIYRNPCDFWQDIKTSGGVAREGGVLYKNGKKPLQLLRRLIKMTTRDDDIILDFFSGSATTAHATLLQNAEDGGRRRFIMVQLPENLDETLSLVTREEKNDIRQLIRFLDVIHRPHLLTEIGKERLRRSASALAEAATGALDTGFRVMKVRQEVG